jgi:MipA family protein
MIRTLTAAAFLLVASPALAQPAGGEAEMPDPNDRSDTLTIAAGVAATPDYEGSDHYRLTPAAAIRCRVGGMNFWSSATWLYLDVIPRPDSGIDFDAGPIVGVRRNRTDKVKDDFVDLLPERNTAIEVGGFAGISMHGLTNPYDSLSFRIDVVHDVGNAHESTLFGPNISFGTPLSRHTYVSASASAEWASGGYADYYYSIIPADSVASGLPVYDADGGFKHWQLGLTGLGMVTGDLTGGLGVFATGSYKRLSGDFKDSPIVDLRGSPSQWLAAVGLAYTF